MVVSHRVSLGGTGDEIMQTVSGSPFFVGLLWSCWLLPKLHAPLPFGAGSHRSVPFPPSQAPTSFSLRLVSGSRILFSNATWKSNV